MVMVRRAAFFDLSTRRKSSGCLAAVREAAARHRSAGDLLVLVAVSGSARPTAEAIGMEADLVLQPGQGRPATVAEIIALLGLDPAQCFGYGDHCEGLRTLRVVGNPRVVGADPTLAEHADSQGWPHLDPDAPDSPVGRP